MNPDDAEQRLQSASAHYPPPPSANDAAQHDFAQSTAAAALLSDQPSQLALLAQQQQQQSNHVTTPTTGMRKRKPAAPGSRGVANLTPEQLSKKRANDREAQRAIRARTKTQIDTLEARIRELESQQPYQEMQRALAERDRAMAECEELRRRLSAVAGIVGSQNLGQMGLNQLAALTAQQTPLPMVADQTPQSKDDSPFMTQYETTQPQPHIHPDLRNAQSSHPASPVGD